MRGLLLRTVVLLFLLSGSFLKGQVNAQKPESDRYQQLFDILPEEMERAEPLINLYLDSLERINADTALTKAYFLMGRLQYYKGQYRVAERFYKKALQRKDLSTMPRLQASLSLNYGVVCDLLARFDESLKWYIKAQKVAETLNDSSLLTRIWINTALLEKRLKRFKDAIKLTHLALKVAQRQNETELIALCYQNLSIFYHYINDYNASFKYRDLALALLRKSNNPVALARHLVNAAEDFLGEGKAQEVIKISQEVLSIGKQLNITDLTCSAYRQLACAYLLIGDISASRENFEKSIELAQSIQSLELEESALAEMLDLFVKTGDQTQFRNVFSRFIDVGNQLRERTSNANMEELKVLYELDKASIKNEALKKENISLQRQRILLFSLISILLIGGIWIYRQHRKLSGFVRSLFLLNVEKAQSPELAGLATPVLKPSTPATEGVPIKEPVVEKALEEQDLDHLESIKRYQQIISLITEQQLFADPEFNIQKLTSLMGSNQKYISQAINKHSNTNFTGLINRLRVNDARRRLIEHPETSLATIMDESGFSNRVTFYRHFKEITGFSPSEFQSLLLNPPVSSTD